MRVLCLLVSLLLLLAVSCASDSAGPVDATLPDTEAAASDVLSPPDSPLPGDDAQDAGPDLQVPDSAADAVEG